MIDVLTVSRTEKRNAYGHERLWLWGQGRHGAARLAGLVLFLPASELVTRDETYAVCVGRPRPQAAAGQGAALCPSPVPAGPTAKTLRAKKHRTPSGDPRLIEPCHPAHRAGGGGAVPDLLLVFSNRTLDSLRRPPATWPTCSPSPHRRRHPEKYGSAVQTLEMPPQGSSHKTGFKPVSTTAKSPIVLPIQKINGTNPHNGVLVIPATPGINNNAACHIPEKIPNPIHPLQD